MRARAIFGALLLAACTHGEPYGIPAYGTDQGALAGDRLTFNLLVDSEASWLPDGSALLYSALRPDFPDTTFCIEQLPARGGTSVASWCPLGPLDSSRAYQAPAVSPSGRLLYLRSARLTPDVGWSVRQLVLTDLLGAPPRAILSSPFPQYTGLSQIRWLTGDRFVFRADLYYVAFCFACLPVEGDSGRFIVMGDLTRDPPAFTRLPGTDTATSVAVQDSDAILYTLESHTPVFRRRLSTGVVDTLFDFAPFEPREVQIAGRRLVATTATGINLVNLDSGTVQVVDPRGFNGLALSPDGKHLVAQRQGDLWEFLLP